MELADQRKLNPTLGVREVRNRPADARKVPLVTSGTGDRGERSSD